VNKVALQGEMSPSLVIRLEAGTGSVTVSTLYRYARCLGIHPKRLMDFDFELED
jgi:hypothetical protein